MAERCKMHDPIPDLDNANVGKYAKRFTGTIRNG